MSQNKALKVEHVAKKKYLDLLEMSATLSLHRLISAHFVDGGRPLRLSALRDEPRGGIKAWSQKPVMLHKFSSKTSLILQIRST